MNHVCPRAAGQAGQFLPVPPGGQDMRKNRGMREVH